MLARIFSNKQESDRRNISFIVEFEVLTAPSGISKLPKLRMVEEPESATDDDTLADCCPWLDWTKCNCNCSSFPALGNVFLDSQTPIKKDNEISDSDEYEEDDVPTFYDNEFACNNEDSQEESDDTLYSEYVALHGSSFHEDCRAALKKCRELLRAKRTVELRVCPELENMRDCNALIIQAKVDEQWDRIGYIPNVKVPKFTVAIRQNKLKEIRFKNIRCQYVMCDNPTWIFMASVLVVKSGKWLPNDGKYRYNDSI